MLRTFKPSRSQIALAVLAAILLVGFGMLADEVLEGDTVAFDTFVTGWFREPGNLADPIGPTWVEEAVRDITGLGGFPILGLFVTAIVLFLWMAGKRRIAVFLGSAVVLGAVISTTLKYVFDRPRPDVEAAAKVFTASFPSGHATVSAVAYLTIGALLSQSTTRPHLKIFYLVTAALLVILIGLSRIYLGVHYPTDVIAGWSIGLAWALISWTIWGAISEKTESVPASGTVA